MSLGFDDLKPQSPVVFEPLVPKALRFDNWSFSVTIPFTDPETDERREGRGIVAHVIEEDGSPVDKPWNILAKHVIQTLRPTLEDGSFMRRVYIVTKEGTGRTAKYGIKVSPPTV